MLNGSGKGRKSRPRREGLLEAHYREAKYSRRTLRLARWIHVNLVCHAMSSGEGEGGDVTHDSDCSPNSVTTQHEHPTTFRAVPSRSVLKRPAHCPRTLGSETFFYAR